MEPAHEIMVLFIRRKLILQTHMRSHPVGLDVWFLVGPFIFFYIPCARIPSHVQGLEMITFIIYKRANSEGWGETARMRRLA